MAERVCMKSNDVVFCYQSVTHCMGCFWNDEKESEKSRSKEKTNCTAVQCTNEGKK